MQDDRSPTQEEQATRKLHRPFYEDMANDRQLTECALRVGHRLGAHYNHKTGQCDPSVPTMIEAMGIGRNGKEYTRQAVMDAVANLEERGWYRVTRKANRRNQYAPVWLQADRQRLRALWSAKAERPAPSPEVTPAEPANDNEDALAASLQADAPAVPISGSDSTSRRAATEAPPRSPARSVPTQPSRVEILKPRQSLDPQGQPYVFSDGRVRLTETDVADLARQYPDVEIRRKLREHKDRIQYRMRGCDDWRKVVHAVLADEQDKAVKRLARAR